MMVLAWVCFSSVGIIIARYYKELWPNSGLIGERVWFQLHRLFMLICVGLNILGIILAFAFCNGYSRVTAYPNYIHPILGLIVFILSLINPFVTLCRCYSGDPNRPWFNWIHFLIGAIAHVLAVPTMMLGFRMPGAGMQLTSIAYPLWILILFIIFVFCIEIILEVHGCIYYRRNKGKQII
ncbi:unnamed protein product [Protopolystoma xenopodis]|uniref:ascorbate ferrireductase (transmembrane) n=1 Tax=Protopolystoma xenopodis TaxID=117903 RepID=A0A3S5BLT9_9PLAT|nr:unnamed protein product [Protopolystoma xenopodis]